MEFKGHSNLEVISTLLRDESPRCAVIVAAAFFDETLKTMLEDTKEHSFAFRIDDAIRWGLLTQDEHDDLHTLRKLRNDFAHDLWVKDFDVRSTAKVDSLKIWTTASQYLRLKQSIHTTLHRLLYVVGVIGFRLQHRAKPVTPSGPLEEPSILTISAWPPMTNI